MIDTDKYEGHAPAPWLWYEDDEGLDLVVADKQCRTVIEEVKALNTKADAELIADAPLLLAEVKRLRKYAELVADIGDMIYENSNSYELTWDEFNEMLSELIE